ncbi:hypothetical protein [Apibacter adventoris]|uniref:Uncharacterized protein n=1 Tax=Apibacter adventoris TaxID=1679466 RepID=A0A2S8AFJ8_9FLAO|nr:hypothetical protein [Apibacter adventoris]PQL94320.1 hypothetical protein C4S77_03055 [Apibacter adventoris]
MIPEVSGDPPKWLSKIIRKINLIKTNTTRWYFNNVVATQPNWSPANAPFDAKGYESFYYWVNGLGKEGRLRYKEGKWGDYMRNNTYIKDFLKDQAYGKA